jgi:hypothetical protein
MSPPAAVGIRAIRTPRTNRRQISPSNQQRRLPHHYKPIAQTTVAKANIAKPTATYQVIFECHKIVTDSIADE